MQKKQRNKARRAKTGITGKASKAGKTGKTGKTGKAGKAGTQGTADRPENTGIAGKVDTLTPEQRKAKRLRDREYRARKRAAACAAERAATTAKPADCDSPCGSREASRARSSRSCRKCGGCGNGFGPAKTAADRRDHDSSCAGGRQGSAGVPPSEADAQYVFSLIGRIVVGELMKAGVPSVSENGTCPVQVERGVVRQEITLPDGRTAAVVVVDGDEVDPFSPHSPLPWPVRRHLLLRRMAQEISDIVDSNLEQS